MLVILSGKEFLSLNEMWFVNYFCNKILFVVVIGGSEIILYNNFIEMYFFL